MLLDVARRDAARAAKEIPVSTKAPHFRIAIAGSGFGGLGMAIRLLQEGIEDFVILERGSDIGGVWRDNTYPGCCCDVPSHLYSFSFAPNPGWSRSFSPSAEIHAYLKGCAERFGLMRFVRLGHEVREAAWQDEEQRWLIQTSQGDFTADVFVAGVGALSAPSIPKLEGLSAFAGKVMHSARWDHSHPLAGRKVAVIGTGASAIQFVPEIQKEVGALRLFQRTPPWILPRNDKAVSATRQRLYRAAPVVQKAARGALFQARELMVLGFRHPAIMRVGHHLALRYLAQQVPEPSLRKKLTPNYTLGCKRVLISDNYLQSLTRPNVEVITEGIREVRPRGIVTSDGVEHEVDTLIFGTGFHVTDMPIAKLVRGRGGKTLDERWQGSPQAHLSTTVSGFPNLFLLLGPNSGLGHNSVLTMLEPQLEHVLKALRFLTSEGLAALEPRAEAQAAWTAEVDRDMKGTVWTSGGCASWYLDRTGRNSTLWPGFVGSFARRVSRFDPSEFVPIAKRSAVSSEEAVHV